MGELYENRLAYTTSRLPCSRTYERFLTGKQQTFGWLISRRSDRLLMAELLPQLSANPVTAGNLPGASVRLVVEPCHHN